MVTMKVATLTKTRTPKSFHYQQASTTLKQTKLTFFTQTFLHTQHPLSELQSSTDTHSDTVYMLYLQVEESGVIWTRGGGSSD